MGAALRASVPAVLAPENVNLLPLPYQSVLATDPPCIPVTVSGITSCARYDLSAASQGNEVNRARFGIAFTEES